MSAIGNPDSAQGMLSVDHLAAHPQAIALLRQWFETEWPEYYGAGGPGDAERDLLSFANRGSLPVGVVAFRQGVPCGFAALKADSIESRNHLSPWAAAGVVIPAERGRGIGARLLGALEHEARSLGYPHIYCGTDTASSLLVRSGWQLIEHVEHDGHRLGIYRKAL